MCFQNIHMDKCLYMDHSIVSVQMSPIFYRSFHGVFGVQFHASFSLRVFAIIFSPFRNIYIYLDSKRHAISTSRRVLCIKRHNEKNTLRLRWKMRLCAKCARKISLPPSSTSSHQIT